MRTVWQALRDLFHPAYIPPENLPGNRFDQQRNKPGIRPYRPRKAGEPARQRIGANTTDTQQDIQAPYTALGSIERIKTGKR